jgi:hypothetical protein
MHQLAKHIFVAAAPLLLTGCLWGPGKFASDLTLKKDGSFVLDYKGEIVLQTPPDAQAKAEPWTPDKVRCRKDGEVEVQPWIGEVEADDDNPVRPCTAAEIAKARTDYEAQAAERAKTKREEAEQMAKMFGLPGFDEESNRAFAAKLGKYARLSFRPISREGCVRRRLSFRGSGDAGFPISGDARQRRPHSVRGHPATRRWLRPRDCSIVHRGRRAAWSTCRRGCGWSDEGRPRFQAQGRFTIITNGEVLTNNSEDGASPHPAGRQIRWDVGSGSSKIPEALIRLR